MSDPSLSTPSDLAHAIETAWARFQHFLVGVSAAGLSVADGNGWTVKDHLTHVAVWEDSVHVLFRGRPRHEALGIPEDLYARASFDEINEIIRDHHSELTFPEAMALLARVHSALMTDAGELTEAQLNTSVAGFFPLAPPGDGRRVLDFILENTAEHYAEHQAWMEALLVPPA